MKTTNARLRDIEDSITELKQLVVLCINQTE